MKKTVVKIIAVLFALILLAGCLTSCSKLGGTYKSVSEGVDTSYKFSLFSDKVTMDYLGFEISGTYEIDGDKIYITILGDCAEHTYSKSGSSIYIDDVEYVKE